MATHCLKDAQQLLDGEIGSDSLTRRFHQCRTFPGYKPNKIKNDIGLVSCAPGKYSVNAKPTSEYRPVSY